MGIGGGHDASDFMNYQLLTDVKDKMKTLWIIISFTVSADTKDKCCSEDSELLQPYYSEEMRNIELLLLLLFKKDMQNIYYCSYL